MTVPVSYYIIHQPKHRIPGVYDLHPRGVFKTYPIVTCEWGFRILADDALRLKVQYLVLKNEAGTDPASGDKYNVRLASTLFDLDAEKGVDAGELERQVEREEHRSGIMGLVREWRDAYVPKTEEGRTDTAALIKKLSTTVSEYKINRLKRLALKNSVWVEPALPRAIQDFRHYLYPLVRNDLYRRYQEMGGREDETQLIKKIASLQRVYTSASDDPLLKPNGGLWKDEDELWACWTGYAGSAEEARRIGSALEKVFRPVIEELKVIES